MDGTELHQPVQVRVLSWLYYCDNLTLNVVFSPATTPTTCADLTAPSNGMIAYDTESMDARPVGTEATFTCITGYTLSVTGDMTRTCGATGDWSGTDPTCECESIQCE